MHLSFKCVLPGRPEAVPYIWYILPLMLIYNLLDFWDVMRKALFKNNLNNLTCPSYFLTVPNVPVI